MRNLHASLLLATTLLAGTAVAATSATAAAEPLPKPTAGCATFTDPKDDATPYNFGSPFPAGPNDPDLDITSVVLASPPGKLRAYVGVTKLGEPEYGVSHRFTVSFMHNGKLVSIWGGQATAPFDSGRDGATAAGATPRSGVTYSGGVLADAVVDAVFDTAASTVILTTDRAPIDKAAKAALDDGVAVTKLTAQSSNDFFYTQQVGDNAAGTADYTVGDNACFQPPAAKLTVTAPAKAVAGHTVTIAGTVSDEAGKAQAGKAVRVAVGSVVADAVSDDKGAFTTSLRLEVPAGTYDATATFAGDSSLLQATASAKVAVAIQPTKASLTAVASGASRVVTVLLVDDLRRPLAGKPITWSVDGKSVRTAKTDAKGRASFTSAPKHTVRVVYAGQRNRYAASQASRAI